MKGIKSFNRNAYYKGKLLTEKDFELEQQYHNDKRRLINKALFGNGVVTGLRVVQLDKENICIEPGLALDSEGREIIIETPIVTKLESIDGYHETGEEQDLLLSIQYFERDEIFEATVGAYDNQHSDVISESYALQILPYDSRLFNRSKMSMSHYKQEIFASEETKVSILVPRFLSKGQTCDIYFEVVHLEEVKSVKIRGAYLATNLLVDQDPSIELIFDQNLFKRNQLMKKIELRADDVGDLEANFAIRKEDLEFIIDDKRFGLEENISFEIYISNQSYADTLKNQYRNQVVNDADRRFTREDAIYLARLFVDKEGFDYQINQVITLPFDQDIGSNAYLDLMSQQRMIEPLAERSSLPQEKAKPELRKEMRTEGPATACGTISIDFSLRAKRNMCFTSPELSHELGMGTVNIDVNFESLVNHEKVYISGQVTAVDRKQYPLECPDFEYAVLSYPEKGTFKIHVRLMENTEATGLKASWFARKDVEPINEIDTTTTLTIAPNSAVLKPKETVLFKAVVHGVRNQEVIWKVVDTEGGKIAENGLYEAPKQIGVYKVLARSVENQNVESVAFVVVKE
ncbi:MAG: hypothetical protein JXO44_05930 [Clostridia bacterium]|nr:hypothetical protein [Clostridia bacterium]